MALEAKKKQVTLVMKGFKENSLAKTQSAVAELNKDTESGLIISPQLFKTYDVNSVPTLVIVNSGGEYDKMSGAVTIDYALGKFREGIVK